MYAIVIFLYIHSSGLSAIAGILSPGMWDKQNEITWKNEYVLRNTATYMFIFMPDANLKKELRLKAGCYAAAEDHKAELFR